MASRCKQCGLTVEWRQTGGRWECINSDDGSDHWDRCSGKRWETVVAEGERFEAQRGVDHVIGYQHHGKERLEQINGTAVTGKHYRPLTCDCDHLPWEVNPNCAQQRAWLAQQ